MSLISFVFAFLTNIQRHERGKQGLMMLWNHRVFCPVYWQHLSWHDLSISLEIEFRTDIILGGMLRSGYIKSLLCKRRLTLQILRISVLKKVPHDIKESLTSAQYDVAYNDSFIQLSISYLNIYLYPKIIYNWDEITNKPDTNAQVHTTLKSKTQSSTDS